MNLKRTIENKGSIWASQTSHTICSYIHSDSKGKRMNLFMCGCTSTCIKKKCTHTQFTKNAAKKSSRAPEGQRVLLRNRSKLEVASGQKNTNENGTDWGSCIYKTIFNFYQCIIKNSQNRLFSSLSLYQNMKQPDFLRHIDFALISSLSSFLSFFSSVFFSFREREGKRERERGHSFVSARERANALRRTERERERERDLFLLRKCPPRNKNGNKMKRLF